MIYSKPCTCSCCPGTMWIDSKESRSAFSEVEDFNPGSEPEWSLHCQWCCDTCGEHVGQCDETFEYPED